MKENLKKLEFSHRSLPQLVNASNEMFINSFALLTDSEKLEGKYVKLDPCEKKIAEEREKEGEKDEGRGREKRERGNAKILF